MLQNLQQIHSKLSRNNGTFKHKTSSPQYPKSNEQIERTIQTIKKSIKEALKGNDDPYLALLAVSALPSPENNTPPAKLFYNRTIKTLLP